MKAVIDTVKFIRRLEKFNEMENRKNLGMNRLAFSESDLKAREKLIRECKRLNLKVDIDGAGNIWAKKDGENLELPSVVFGSHIDTVPEGGQYDGILGVLAGLEVIRIIKENDINHKRSIELICFSAEESSRFNISTVGSKLLVNKIDTEKLRSYSDSDSVCLYDRMKECGFDFDKIKTAQERLRKASCFIELHIEQGPILERMERDIGVVHTIAAPTRLRVIVIGEEAHSGACPIDMRKDALVASAEIICGIEKIGKEESRNHTVATVGKCDINNSAINIVPGTVELFVDIRGIDMECINIATDKISELISKTCLKRELNYFIEVLAKEKPVKLDEELNTVIKNVCSIEGKKFLDMNSGAGHDVMNVASIIPSALIFIPCIKGISHNKHEDVKIKDIENGIEVLYKTVYFLANDVIEYSKY